VRSARLSALMVLAGLVIAGLVVDAADTPDPAEPVTVVRPGVAMPTARAEPTLGSTWYCAGGTASEGGMADHTIQIANPTDRPRQATVTVLTGEVATSPPPADAAGGAGEDTTTTTAPPSTSTTVASTTTARPAPIPHIVELPALSRVDVRLAELLGAPATLAGAVVEVDGGQLAVEHNVNGDLGRATAPCSTTASASWSLPWGVTSRGNRELIVFMNPFPDDATVDVSFATDEGVRDVTRFEGFIVPGRSVVGAFVEEDMRRAQVSADIRVRGGRLIVDRIQAFDGTDGRQGLSLALGVPSAAETWMFPAGGKSDSLSEQVVVYNPGEEVAEVEVEVRLDDPGELGPPEPFELTVAPGRYALVDLTAEERVPAGGHALVVRSLNGVPVAAEKVNWTKAPATSVGVTSTTGSPFAGPTWYFAAGGPSTESARDEFLVLFNPDPDEDVTYDVTGFRGGQSIPIQGLQGGAIPAGGRAVIRLGDHLDNDVLSVVIQASGPIVAERGLHRIGGLGISQAMGIPYDEGLVVPDPVSR